MAPVLSSVPLCRVQLVRTTGNTSVSTATVTATPTVKSLTVAGQHGYIDLVPVVSQIDPSNPTVSYLDLVVTDDPDVAETFGWTISFNDSDRPTRTVSVPQSGAGVTTITVGGVPMPSVWLDALAVFTGTSGATGPGYATTGYVTSAISALQAAPDPFSQYALDTDVAAVRQAPTVNVFAPPVGSGLAAAVGDNTANDAPAIQAALTYVKNTFGGGRVVVSKPNAGVKCLSGLTVPAKVQLVSDELTLLNFSQAPAGTTAITVNDTNFTPLVGIRMDGGNFTPSSTPNDTSIGVSITGSVLTFRDLHLQYFGRGIDAAHSNTFILTFSDSAVGRCGTALYLDYEVAAAGNAGERIVLDRCVLANSNRAFQATGNGTHLRFNDCSIDFCTDIGKVNNGVVFFSGHIETNSTPHLFDVTGNAQMLFSDTRFVLAKCVLFKTGQGPSNYGFGAARFNNCTAYFLDNTGAPTNRLSEDLVSWPANTTSLTVFYPWPLKYCAITADFCFNDGGSVVNSDKVLVTSMSSTTGALTLTAPTNATGRWVRVKF